MGQKLPCAASPPPGWRQRLSIWLRAAMEGVVLLLVVLLPWGFSWVLGLVEWALFTGVAVLLLLWAARMLLEWRPIWVACPITLCLAGLFLLGVWQITPLPRSLLATLSPATTQLNERLLPPKEPLEAVPLAAGATISLYPGGSRAYLLRLLAVVVLFAAVRSNVASAASFRRLALVALVNGFLLALVGLLQFFSSPRNVIYWTFESPAHVFGPFNRNDFAFHNNLCIGLGIGLLLAGRTSLALLGHGPGTRRLGDDPASLWIGAALVLMLTALALCLSRGGVFSLLGAVAIVAVLARAGRAGAARFGLVAVLLCLALGLAAWFGLDETHNRMAQLWKNEGPGDSRWQMWLQTAPYAREFPVWGTGLTTFGFLERMSRGPRTGLDVVYENAHNDYLNLLLEGGLVGLALGLAALGLAWAWAVRAFWRHREQPAGGLALGGLVALTTAALHSFVDFGLQLPAIAVLVAVLVAHLAALGRAGAAERLSRPAGGWAFVPRTAGTLLGTAGAVALAWALLNEGRARELAERYRLAAQVLETSTDRSGRHRRIAYLRARASLAPTDAERQQSLADALYEAFRAEKAALQEQARAVEATGLVLAGGGTSGGSVNLAGQAALTVARSDVLAREEQRLSDEYLRPALARYVMARRLCPLLARPHVCLAAHAGAGGGEPASVHLGRARLLLPYNAEVWFLSGAMDLQQGDRERAWRNWRRSLGCSAEHLEDILARSRKHLAPEAIVALVLPDDPELMYEAALKLAGEGEDAQRPFLRRAVELLRERPGEPKDGSLLLEARALVRLNRAEEALPAFERLAARAPRDVDWRYEFAQALSEQGRLDEARRELRTLLQQQPEHRRGKELYQTILRRQSEGP